MLISALTKKCIGNNHFAILIAVQYAVVCFPKINSDQLAEFRKKYDPKWLVIPPHITLVFPANHQPSEALFQHHIEKIVRGKKSFRILLQDTHLSHDNYLFLLTKTGNEEIIALHDELYTGVLSPFLRKDLVFTPHMTIGQFGKEDGSIDEKKYQAAQTDFAASPFSFETTIDTISLIKIDGVYEVRNVICQFYLSKDNA